MKKYWDTRDLTCNVVKQNISKTSSRNESLGIVIEIGHGTSTLVPTRYIISRS